MTDDKMDSAGGMRRRWLVWGTVGAVALLTIVVVVVAVPLLRPTTAAPTPTPSTTTVSPVASSTPTPTPTPTPTCTVATPDLVWSDPYDLDLPSDGRTTSTPIQRIDGVREKPGIWPDDASFAIDEERVGVLTNANGLDGTSYLTVIERDGTVRWEVAVDGYASVLSAPATTGVPGRLILEAHDADDYRMISYDIATGDVLHERESGEVYAITRHASRASFADVAPVSADAFFVSDRESLSRVDPATLEAEWSVSGDEFGVDWFEGGVPFDVVTDVVFVGTHAVDARTGEALGWESAGAVFEAAGATLQTPLLYDAVGPYDFSGLDTRTGESCWTREVVDIAATLDTLWVLLPDGAIERIDPLTGETIEKIAETAATSILATGDRLIAMETDREDYTAPVRYTAYDGTAPFGAVEVAPGRGGFVSGDQLLFYDYGSVKNPATLTAYERGNPSPVWQIDGEGLSIEAGVVLRTTWDAENERVDVELLR